MADKLFFRRAVLAQLEAASPASLPLETLAAGLAVAGFVFSEKELLSDIEYLAGKGYLELCRSKISSGHVRLRLSPAGRDYLESGDY